MLYMPPKYQEDRAADALALIRDLGFGTLASISGSQMVFSHIPLIPVMRNGRLAAIAGHLARANPHVAALEDQPEATILFNGPNHYMSAQWYTPGNPAAPTWNYVVVHAEGRIRLARDEAETSAIVDDLIRANEARLPEQWDLDSYSPERRAILLKHIVGITLEDLRLTAKFKLTQHYGDADKRGAAAGLQRIGSDNANRIAAYMLETCAPPGQERAGRDVTAFLRDDEPNEG
jgi:transcriptional regulator